jgi:CBS domain-containing membrane protein
MQRRRWTPSKRTSNRAPASPALPSSGPLKVADVMSPDVVTIGPDAPLAEAIALLADAHLSGLAVVNTHRRLLGVVSAQDILAAEAETRDPKARARVMEELPIRDIMSSPAHVVHPDLELREAALEMEYADIHRLFVVVDGTLVGVLSMSDVNRAFARERR